jgi:ABC-type transport system involved in cytochrome bd biosynthesis fused ATPase/permease subunit
MKDLTLKERFKAKSPKLFRKITNASLTIGVIGGTILTIASGGILLPAYLLTVSGYMVTVGAVGAAVSKITVSDKVDENE